MEGVYRVYSDFEAIILIDLKGKVLEWSDSAERVYQYQAGEVIGKFLEDLIVPDHKKDEVFSYVDKIRSGLQLVQLETERKRRDGTIIKVSTIVAPYIKNKNLAGCFIVSRNISHLKELEEELRVSSRQFEKFLDLSVDLFGIFDGEAKLLKGSKSFVDTFGYTYEEITNQTFISLLHPEDVAKASKALENLNKGIPLINFVSRVRCADGSWKLISWQAMKSIQENVIYTSGRDVSREKEFQTQLEELVNQRTSKLMDALKFMETLYQSILSHLNTYRLIKNHMLDNVLDDADGYK